MWAVYVIADDGARSLWAWADSEEEARGIGKVYVREYESIIAYAVSKVFGYGDE